MQRKSCLFIKSLIQKSQTGVNQDDVKNILKKDKALQTSWVLKQLSEGVTVAT